MGSETGGYLHWSLSDIIIWLLFTNLLSGSIDLYYVFLKLGFSSLVNKDFWIIPGFYSLNGLLQAEILRLLFFLNISNFKAKLYKRGL
jgi:hypothetical protein